jgi:hypothetical protein
VEYVNHRLAGSAPTDDGGTHWTLVWTAPDRGGTVMFHAAGNAADGDDSAMGDHVHTATLSIQAAGHRRGSP